MSLHGNCGMGAALGFCQIAVWRTIAQDWRAADRRPIDGRP